MTEVLAPELVVSSWPFRTGTVVYDPTQGRDVAEWVLGDLLADSQMLRRLAPALNPFLPYTQRALDVLHLLESDQVILRDALGVEGSHICPLLSGHVERELADFATSHHLQLTDLSLPKPPRLLKKLSERSPQEHHAFASEWWERYERPAYNEGASTFRTHCGPGAGYYQAKTGDAHSALRLWEEEARTPLDEFSLWTALHCHWG